MRCYLKALKRVTRIASVGAQREDIYERSERMRLAFICVISFFCLRWLVHLSPLAGSCCSVWVGSHSPQCSRTFSPQHRFTLSLLRIEALVHILLSVPALSLLSIGSPCILFSFAFYSTPLFTLLSTVTLLSTLVQLASYLVITLIPPRRWSSVRALLVKNILTMPISHRMPVTH